MKILGVYKTAKIKPSAEKIRKQAKNNCNQDRQRRALKRKLTSSHRGTEKQN